jgi:regulator of nonsense transcripts 3
MATTARTQNGLTTGSSATGEGGRKSKAQATGQKLMIRHLPPLITEDEVQAILGEEWKLGNGKVDWAQFHQGKVSKRYAPSTLTMKSCY